MSRSTPVGPRRGRRGRVGIFHKLAGVVGALVTVLVGLLAAYFADNAIEDQERLLLDKAATYGRLVAHEVRSAVAFDDVETAREVFDAVATDEDVTGLALLTSEGAVLHARGAVGLPPAEDTGGTLRVRRAPGILRVTAPVVSAEGPTGTLVVEVSTAGLEARSRSIVKAAVGFGALVLAAALVAAALVARSFARRIEVMSELATAVAHGDLDRPARVDPSGDEIGALSDAFGAMVTQLRELLAQTKRQADEDAERLGRLVRERTAALDATNESLRLVLDNIGEGFVVVDRDGRLVGERSAILQQWFGPAGAETTLWDYLAATDAAQAEWLAVSWEELGAGVLPIELALDQLPARFRAGPRTFGVRYRPLGEGDDFEHMLVMMSDLSGELARERAEQEQRELLVMVGKLVDNRRAFLEFFGELSDQVQALRDPSADLAAPLTRRIIHTIKGNCSVYGVQTLADLCHLLETRIDERGEAATPAEIDVIGERFDRLYAHVEAWTTDKGGAKLDVDHAAHRRAVRALRAGAPPRQVAALLETWALESADERLERMGEHATWIATRRGIGDLVVETDGGGLRFAAAEWAPFWASFVHVLRNAVDHGLQTSDERHADGKDEPPTLRLSARLRDDDFEVIVTDNGRGIDWEKVRRRAAEKGLAHSTHEDLVNALCADGFSTTDEVTELSGRGVGLSALRAACTSRGGVLVVDSEAGRGTAFTFRWPSGTVSVVDPSRIAPIDGASTVPPRRALEAHA